MSIAPVNPFEESFETTHSPLAHSSQEINRDAFYALRAALTIRAQKRGRTILLRAPRAGFGKSHLLNRLIRSLQDSHLFFSIEPDNNATLCLSAILFSILTELSPPSSQGITRLDSITRQLLGSIIAELVNTGDIPANDPDSVALSLREHPEEALNFENPEAPTTQWVRENFDLLGSRLASTLSQKTNIPYTLAAWWLELFYRYTSAPSPEKMRRRQFLFETLQHEKNFEDSQKLSSLLTLLGYIHPCVLVFDELESFSSKPAKALEASTFITGIQQRIPSTSIILSLNNDIWQNAFAPSLSCGLKDRLCDIVIDLESLTPQSAQNLLLERSPQHAEEVLKQMDLDVGVLYARGLLKKASEIWEKLELSSPEPSTTTPPPPTNNLAQQENASPPLEETPPFEPFATPVEEPLSFLSEEETSKETKAPPAHEEETLQTNHNTSGIAAFFPPTPTEKNLEEATKGDDNTPPFEQSQPEIGTPFSLAETNDNTTPHLAPPEQPKWQESPFRLAEQESPLSPDSPQKNIQVTEEDKKKVDALLREFQERHER